jgi:ethanolamine ammonia-lyase small subunit
MSGAPPRDPWARLGSATSARIALGRVGASLPTREVLAFALAHAKARDAVHATLDRAEIAGRLAALGLATVEVESRAAERRLYLARPDLGRLLEPAARERLAGVGAEPGRRRHEGLAQGRDRVRGQRGRGKVRGRGRSEAVADFDLALVVADGLSATAVAAHAVAVVEAFLPHAERSGLRLAPVALAIGARVALGDEIGAMLRAKAVAVLIGERPGLSAADGLGIYLTLDPRPGRTDAERNCLSNIRAGGLEPVEAAAKLAWLLAAAERLGATGVALKDESEAALPASAASAERLPPTSRSRVSGARKARSRGRT